MKNAPVESDPEITMRPATSSTRAWATSGRKVRSGTYSARWRFAASVRAKTVSAAAANRSERRLSCENDLTTWTPAIDSSATVATSARDCCTSRSTGWETRLYRYGKGDHRGDRDGDERELPAVEEEHGGDSDDRHDVLREEDQPVAEEKAHRLQVDRRPRHELAGLTAVVEPERKPQEVRVEIVTEVVLDTERLSARDDPSPVLERAADEAQPDDGRDLDDEEARVRVGVELVDDDPGEDEDEDPRDLRQDREQRRDDERRPVGAKEGEQAHERAPARRSVGLRLVCGHGPRRVRIVLEAVPNVSKGGSLRRRRDRPRLRDGRDRARRARGSGPPPVGVHARRRSRAARRCAPGRSLDGDRAHRSARPRGRASQGGRRRRRPLVPLASVRWNSPRTRRVGSRPHRVGARTPGLPLRHDRRRAPPAYFRRGGLATLQRRVETGELARRGSARIDPGRGAVLVGSRQPLVAYNVELATGDVGVAREIAAVTRESGGGMPGVQAIGLYLPSSGRVQVSMNVVDVERAPLHDVIQRVRTEAASRASQ